MKSALVPFIGLSLALACGGGDEPEVASAPQTTPAPQPEAAVAPPPAALALSTLPRQWTEVKRAGDGWTFANGCSVNGDLLVDATTISAGGCGGPIKSSRADGDRLVIELTEENSGETATATFRWVDRAAGVGEWTWTGCLLQPVLHMEYEQASKLAPEAGCVEQ